MTLVVHRLHLGHVALPDTHPRSNEKTCPIVTFAIESPDGIVVVDTGPRTGHPVIDEMYAPQVGSMLDALHGVSLDERDIISVVNTHLHFDHCGQNHLFPHAPIWISADELRAASTDYYTVPEWAHIDPERRRLSSDNEEIATGVHILHTPGHTPGHQSVLVHHDSGASELIAGQACYSCGEFTAGVAASTDMHDASWLEVGRQSLARLRRLDAAVVHFSHDIDVLTG